MGFCNYNGLCTAAPPPPGKMGEEASYFFSGDGEGAAVHRLQLQYLNGFCFRKPILVIIILMLLKLCCTKAPSTLCRINDTVSVLSIQRGYSVHMIPE